jgi:hypothetical protein
MSNQFILPIEQIINPTTGRPVFNARLFFGRQDATDLATNPASRVPVFFVDGSGAQVALAQPVRTNAAGNPVNPAGAPVQIRVQVNPADTAYSFLAQTDGGAQVLYQARISEDFVLSSELGAVDSDVVIAGIVAKALSARVAAFVTPEEFGAVGDGLANDTAAVQAALDTNKLVMLNSNACYRLNSKLVIRRGHKGIVGTNSVFDTVGGTSASGSYFDFYGTGAAISFESQDNDNRTVVGARLEHFGIKLRNANSRGIDYTQAIYGEFNNIWVRLLASSSTGFYAKGNGQGSAPYYNVFDGCLVFGNNDRVAFPEQVGFYGQGDGIFLADGPNANIYNNTRHLVGLAYGFIFESGVGNVITNLAFESIQEAVFLIGKNDTAADGRCQENIVTGVWGEGTSTARIADIRGMSRRNNITKFSTNSTGNIVYTDTTTAKDNYVSSTGESLTIEFNGRSFPANTIVPIGFTAANWPSVGSGGITPSIKGYPAMLIVNCFSITGSIVGNAVVRIYRAGNLNPILTATITDANRFFTVYNIGDDVTSGYNLFDKTQNSSLEVVVATSSDWNQPNATINASVYFLSV